MPIHIFIMGRMFNIPTCRRNIIPSKPHNSSCAGIPLKVTVKTIKFPHIVAIFSLQFLIFFWERISSAIFKLIFFWEDRKTYLFH